MFSPVKIAPSILSADFLHLGREISQLEEAGAAYIHLDVMDGHFVPNLSMGVPLLRQVAALASIPCDVHLMVSNPLDQIPWYLEAGAGILCFHAEPLGEDGIHDALTLIHEANALSAVALKPYTPVSTLAPFIEKLDMVLIMSVEPGFSGQRYQTGIEKKVVEVVAMASERGVSPLIEVDGGINAQTAPLVSAVGADVLVCGNAYFAAPDPAAALREIAEAGEEARRWALSRHNEEVG